MRAAAALRFARPLLPMDVVNSVRLGLTVIAALYLSMLFELQRPEWAAWTVLSVSLTTRASSLQKASWRIFGSLVGAMAAVLLVAAFAQDTLFFDAVLALWLGLATAGSTLVRGQRSYGFSLIGFTVPIITLANVGDPLSVFSTAVDRCSALLLGIACAHASATLVATDTQGVQARLGSRMAAATAACTTWLRAGQDGDGWAAPPIKEVLGLDMAVTEAFVEQPSLRTGGSAVAEVPGALLEVLASGMLASRLPGLGSEAAERLLGWRVQGTGRRLRRAQAAASTLLAGGRIGWRRAPSESLALDSDRQLALNNGLRTAIAISLVNAFWYVSEWPSGGVAVTWAALVSALLASRDNAAKAATDFFLGGALAYLIGVGLHYTILTTTGDFGLLAAAILPVGMLGAIGRFDSRAVISGGFGITVFTAIEPLNHMQYDFAVSLNEALAALAGIGTAVLAFGALPPPASPATRRARAKRRMVRAVRIAAERPVFLLPRPHQWAAPMFERMALVAPDGPDATMGAQTLLLAGLLILALRKADGAWGRTMARHLFALDPQAREVWAGLAELLPPVTVEEERADTIAALLRSPILGEYPGLWSNARDTAA